MAVTPLIKSNLRGTRQSQFRIQPADYSGAPTSGTFALGDLHVDSAGILYRCSVAGTPGTWIPLAGQASSEYFSIVGF